MQDSEALETLATCFVPVGRSDWRKLTSSWAWDGFIDAMRRIVQEDAPLGAVARPGLGRSYLYPIQDFLATSEMRALFAPPAWEEHVAFSRAHLWPGCGDQAFPAGQFAAVLEDVASLVDAGEADRAERSFVEHLAWLPARRMRLALLDGSAFYLGLVDVAVAVWSRLSGRIEQPDRPACISARASMNERIAQWQNML